MILKFFFLLVIAQVINCQENNHAFFSNPFFQNAKIDAGKHETKSITNNNIQVHNSVSYGGSDRGNLSPLKTFGGFDTDSIPTFKNFGGFDTDSIPTFKNFGGFDTDSIPTFKNFGGFETGIRSTCKKDWDNTCRSSNECCSDNCENHDGQWLYGICKPGSGTPRDGFSDGPGGGNCKPNWDNTCKSSSECCSGKCDNHQSQWIQGVCMP